jgi:hypothetical protein
MRWLHYDYILGRHQELKPEHLGSQGIDWRIFIMDLE